MKSLEDIVKQAMTKRRDEILKEMNGGKKRKGGNFLSGLKNDLNNIDKNLNANSNKFTGFGMPMQPKYGKKRTSYGGEVLVDDLNDNIGAGRPRKNAPKVNTRGMPMQHTKYGDGGVALAEFRRKVTELRNKRPNLSYREAQKIVSNK